jgi:hypothetical protein
MRERIEQRKAELAEKRKQKVFSSAHSRSSLSAPILFLSGFVKLLFIPRFLLRIRDFIFYFIFLLLLFQMFSHLTCRRKRRWRPTWRRTMARSR